MSLSKTWLKFYEDIPHSISYPRISLYERVMQTVEQYPDAIAWDFMGTTSTYRQFAQEIDKFANALTALGFQKGDTITISMPTSPNGVIPIYAVNKLGGICSMIHPMSPAPQIKMYLNISKSKWALTLDIFYGQFKKILHETSVNTLILAKATDYLSSPLLRFGYWLKKGRKIPKIVDPQVVWYRSIMQANNPPAPKVDVQPDDPAIILYSGGTTGIPKGILLSNYNMISEGMMVSAMGKLNHTHSVLAILPIFHGFGLGVCVNAAFMAGGKTILVPTFTPQTVAKLIKKTRPNFVNGVPTLFEALANDPNFQKSNLACLEGAYSGADTLPRKVKEKFEAVVKNCGGSVKLLEGYGLTEAVTAIMAIPREYYKEGSIGIPFPDMMAKICKMGTTEELPIGQEGEICVSGPAVMLGYLDNPEETAKTLRKHPDGQIWLHTGDIGTMDADGFFFFKLREKRMLKVSGVNVYPNHVEETLRKHPEVDQICVVGVPDKTQMTRVKAFVVLKKNTAPSEDVKKSILNFALSQLLKWECPREIEFRTDLPKTLVGKIAYKNLEDEELTKLKQLGTYPFDTQA
ncbi:MAG: Acyl-CoA synthetases (AMP-forming)/AMP-acid ligases II [Promethearchaeota archaeon CR_4]|nr:MAG: Acyl-CoA synthetases (AMP-forming)/AMP-acid ligases II [Candidatus Lokiarchaeota archaeon CR_4]